ncbi:MAG: hypothetical protein J6K73_00430 [Clostridia bacterium]|nr:hypothetical protein [Clostridia bacterium]MBP3648229.1 hypothetical protein [Clostridia bacterium]
MSFWEKIKQTLRSFMNGRNGTDQLSLALLWGGLICYLLSSILGSFVNRPLLSIVSMLFSFAGLLAYGLCIYRMFSRNLDKRRAENRRYVTFMERQKKKRNQAANRFRNRKVYKYFKCPGCKAWLRLKRGSGVVTITCSRCHTSFTQKS